MKVHSFQSFCQAAFVTDTALSNAASGLKLKRNIVSMILLATLSLIFLSPTQLWAKKAHFHFDNISQEQGLPNEWVMKVLQDRQGFIWIGSQYGLFRYDGYDFKAFKHTPEDPSSLAGNYIQNLYQDSQGVLWVSMWRGGFAQYHPETESFTNYRHEPNNQNSLSNDEVFDITEDQEGDLWIATLGGGLNRFDRNNNSFTHYRHDPHEPDSIGDDKVYTVLEDSQGILWVGTRSSGLNRFNKKTGTFTRYQYDPNNPTSLSHNKVYTLFEDPGGTLWIGTRGGGLNRFDRQTESFQRYLHDPNDHESLSSDMVWDIFEDLAGALWVGTYRGGLNRFDKTNEHFVRYQHDPQDKHSLADNDVFSITQDKNGLLWLGTFSGGLSKFDPASKRFGLVQHDANATNGLSKGNVQAILKDKAGILWVGTESGLNSYDPITDLFQHYRHEPDNPQSISDNNIWTIFEDSAGNLWVGARNGLNQLNRQDNSFIHYRHQPENPDSISDNTIMTIQQDKQGNLWVGTNNGLNLFNPQSNTFTRYYHSSQVATSISHSTIYSLLIARDGALWVGTSGGLNQFNHQKQTFKRYLNDPNNPNSLSHNSVNAIAEDAQGNLWIATSGGLNKFDPNSETFSHYRKNDGLPSDRFSAVLIDKDSNIWLGGDGIARFNPESAEIIAHIGAEAGCGSNHGAYFQAADGQLFFGIQGYCAFYPEDAFQASQAPTVVLTDFRLLNKSVLIANAETKSPLTQVINHTQALTLSHIDNVLSFEFAALHYAEPKRNQYQYKLEGFNRDWIETEPENRRATFTSLPSGDYTFRVKASNNQGVWNEQGRAIKLTILPAPWRTWWAYTIYALVLVTLVLTFVRVQSKKIRLERAKKTADAANQAKSEFLANMSHELRTPLNAVLGFSEILSDRLTEPQNKNFIERINLAGTALLSLIDSVLDLAKIEAGKLELELAPTSIRKLFDEMESIFIGTLAQKDVAFYKQVAPSVPEYLLLDPHRMRDALMNFCSNACQFTNEGEVTIRAEAIHKKDGDGFLDLKLHITDTGKGIASEDFERIFKPFEQSQGQKYNEYGGTGLGLSITRRFIELMNGKIDLQSEVGIGSHFTVTLNHVEIAESASLEDELSELDYNLVTFAPAKILLVDDIAYNREVVTSFLEHWPFTIVQAKNGIEVLELCESEHFDIILLDMRMPQMDGYETSERLKSQTKTASIPIVAITSSVLKQNVNKVLAHCDMYLAKPLKKAVLVNALMNYIEYIQEDSKLIPQSNPQPVPWRHLPDLFIGLSHQHRQELEYLLTTGHLRKLEEFIEQLPEDLGETAQFLRQKINQYDFEGIKKALKAYKETLANQDNNNPTV